jgi:hypothetical protein
MTPEQISKIEKSIQNLENKLNKIYFLVQDTKGNAKASLSYIYRMALSLRNNGFNPIMLHEKNDYTKVGLWLGEEFDVLEHQSIENQNLAVTPEDFIVIPELYGFVMEQITKLPCGKIVLCQAYDHMLETLQPGQTWSQFGFYKCITTSEQQKELISSIMRGISIDVVQPLISDNFSKQEMPAKPIIAIHTREQRDTLNIIKTFYLKFPQYRWITFRDMRGLTELEFANILKDSFVSVWVDETSSYGTFPLESMKTNVPVIGLVPNVVPSWMNEDNGLWVNNKNQVVDIIADFLQNWLEDNINSKLFEAMDVTISELPSPQNFESKVINLFEGFNTVRKTSFEEQINKFDTIEQ